MGRWRLSTFMVRLAGVAALDQSALFQTELHSSLELEQAPGALPTTDMMPGLTDTTFLFDMLRDLNETIQALRDDSTLKVLSEAAGKVSNLFNEHIRKQVNDAVRFHERSLSLNEMDTRKLVAEAVFNLNTSFRIMNESLHNVKDGLEDIIPEPIRPSTIYNPKQVLKMMEKVLNNTQEPLQRIMQRPEDFTLSDFCDVVNPIARGCIGLIETVDLILEKHTQSVHGNSQENPEYSPLVMLAPDVIRPLQLYLDDIMAGGQQIHMTVKELYEKWTDLTVHVLHDRIKCHLSKEALRSSASSRSPLGLMAGAVAALLWLSVRQPQL